MNSIGQLQGLNPIILVLSPLHTLISLINVESTLTTFEKFQPPQKEVHPPQNCFFLNYYKLHKNGLSQTLAVKAKCFIYIQKERTLAAIFQPPHFLILQLLHPSTFIPTSTFIREMRVCTKKCKWQKYTKTKCNSMYWLQRRGCR